jgi:hypothetical protein
MINLLITVFGVGMVLRKHSRDPEMGWAWLVGLMLILPSEVRFHLPGALPELTAHRILLGLGLLLLLRGRNGEEIADKVPLMKAFGFMALTQFISNIGATEKVVSFKDWLGFVTEQFLFAWMMWRCIKTPRGIRLLLGSVAVAMVAVGTIAAVERYGDMNLAARFIPYMKDDERTTTSTFRHRIMFGYFMSFGVPMMLAFVSIQQSKWNYRRAWLGLLLSMAGSYLSISRGPWLGAALGAGFLACIGGKRIRRVVMIVGVIGMVVMLSRPGVYETLARLYEHSKTTDTHKGRSFQYRFELWGVAWRMLGTSVERAAFGFGGGSLETMDLTDAFEFGGNAGNLGYTSWDSEYAAMFMKFGIVGMLAAILLYGSAGVRLWRAIRTSDGDNRLIIIGCCGAFGVFLFCMTNVAIFNPQVRFLAWLAVMIGLKQAAFASQPTPTVKELPDEPFIELADSEIQVSSNTNR